MCRLRVLRYCLPRTHVDVANCHLCVGTQRPGDRKPANFDWSFETADSQRAISWEELARIEGDFSNSHFINGEKRPSPVVYRSSKTLSRADFWPGQLVLLQVRCAASTRCLSLAKPLGLWMTWLEMQRSKALIFFQLLKSWIIRLQQLTPRDVIISWGRTAFGCRATLAFQWDWSLRLSASEMKDPPAILIGKGTTRVLSHLLHRCWSLWNQAGNEM